MAAEQAGTVSVVLVNYRGAEDTVTCLESLQELDWPADRIEVICVDNASGDGSVERIKAAAPGVELVCSPANSGFTGGCAQGVARASGEYLAFITNDARPDPSWLRAAVEVLDHDPGIGCVASKILDWDGNRVDFAGGGLQWTGHGFPRGWQQAHPEHWDEARDVLFASAAAMIARASLYRETGGFDDRYFTFVEDVDFGWRLNMLGHRVRYVPTSVVYHRHHGSSGKQLGHHDRFLLERNALMSMYKNFSDQTLARTFGPALALAVHRCFWLGHDDTSALDLRHGSDHDEEFLQVSTTGMAGAFAVDSMIDQIAALHETRQDLQRRRRRSDSELMPLFLDPLSDPRHDGAYQETRDTVIAAFGIDQWFGGTYEVAEDSAFPPPADDGDLLLQYRAVAAERAVRNTELDTEVISARRTIAALERKLNRAVEDIARLESKLSAERTRAPSTVPSPPPSPSTQIPPRRRVRRTARRLLRRAARRLRRDRTPDKTRT